MVWEKNLLFVDGWWLFGKTTKQHLALKIQQRKTPTITARYAGEV